MSHHFSIIVLIQTFSMKNHFVPGYCLIESDILFASIRRKKKLSAKMFTEMIANCGFCCARYPLSPAL